MRKSNNIINLDDFTEDSYGYYQSIAIAFERELELAVQGTELVSQLHDAVDYALFPAGKRIRPMLACSVCADLKGDVEQLLPVVVALEFLHSASLIHDDLPALDNDDMRRGKPSCHKQFNEATAVLAGDILIPMAYQAIIGSDYSDVDKAAFTAALTEAYIGLCNGQQLDMLPVDQRGELERVHQLKTGALFKASVQFGAIAAGRNPELFSQLGLSTGILFQFVDDMLDVFGGAGEKGRDTSSDMKNSKETLATTGNREIFERRLLRLKSQIEEALSSITETCGRQFVFPKVRFLLSELYSRAESI